MVYQGPPTAVEICLVRSMDGFSAFTTRLAVAALPLPPSVDVTFEVELALVPAVVPVTLTEKVHEVLAARVAVVGVPRLIAEEPAVAVMVPPPQVPLNPLGVATTSPNGRVSVKLIPLSAVARLGLVTVKVNEVELPVKMVVAPKFLVMLGGAATVNGAVAYPLVLVFVPLCVEVMFPLTFIY